MSEHHEHYFNHIDENMKAIITSQHVDQPLFVGQGWSESVGSDTYGGYVVAKKQIGRKVIWGLCNAATKMRTSWTEGTEDCFLPNDKTDPVEVKAAAWIVQSGFWKNRSSNLDPNASRRPKFSFCDPETGCKYPRSKCTYYWNGAHSYRDPSF